MITIRSGRSRRLTLQFRSRMQIRFAYPGYEGIEFVEIPDTNLLGVYEPLAVDDVDEEDLLAQGFEKPYGAMRLRDAVRASERLLVLVEDGTRGTPIPRLL